MEADQLASENPDQTVCIQKDDDEGASQGRSYECNFCKKNFSNAQALGGHMNIHRKEKAKLKEAPQETQHLLDIPCGKPNLELMSSQVKSTTPKRPWDFSSSEDCSSRSYPRSRTLEAGEVKQLPLFDETVASRNPNSPKPTSQTDENSQEGLPSSQGEVDLELRLGHQEPTESSDTLKAQKFF